MTIAKPRTKAVRSHKTKARIPKFTSVQEAAVRATDLLKALGSTHRLAILCLLNEGDKTVTEICDVLGARQSLVSQHLTRLRLDGLVRAERKGYFVSYSMISVPTREIIATLHKHFCSNAPSRLSD